MRPRTAALCVRLDAQDRPAESDLVLATRDGEVVWRGQVSAGAWLLGLRMRARCTGPRDDGLWVMVRALLEAELAGHGLHVDGRGDLPLDVASEPDGCCLTTRCGVVPLVERLGVHAVPDAGVDEHVRRASRVALPAR